MATLCYAQFSGVTTPQLADVLIEKSKTEIPN